RSQQDFPVIATGMQGEASGDQQYLSSAHGQRAVKFGETQVVADCQAKGDAIDFSRDKLVAWHNALGFVMLLTVGQIYIEKVDFAILRDNLTIPVDQHGSIV